MSASQFFQTFPIKALPGTNSIIPMIPLKSINVVDMTLSALGGGTLQFTSFGPLGAQELLSGPIILDTTLVHIVNAPSIVTSPGFGFSIILAGGTSPSVGGWVTITLS